MNDLYTLLKLDTSPHNPVSLIWEHILHEEEDSWPQNCETDFRNF